MFTITISTPDLGILGKIASVVDGAVNPAKEDKAPKEKAAAKPEKKKEEAPAAQVEAVKNAIQALAALQPIKQKALDTLGKFGATNFNTLTTDHYEAFLKAASEVLAQNSTEGLL